jgi:protein-S-isoprenylcysteine O-methyltransferase Ste14
MRPRLLPPACFAALLALMLLLHFVLPVAQWNPGATRWWGIPFTAAGALLLAAALRRFSARTTRNPYERPSVLIEEGPYRFSRNPMYAGLLLALAGAAVMLGSLSPLLALPLFVLLVQTRFIAHEERVLEERFGADYRAYRRRVRRWL